MKQGHKTWMAAVAFALCANAAGAAQMPNDGAGGPDASALIAFYGVSLATSPAGAAEDKAVWMAKVQGLIAQAPAWLQQNVLASQTKAEFAANLAILESMQKGTLESAASTVKTVAAKTAKVTAQGGGGPDNLGGSNRALSIPPSPPVASWTRAMHPSPVASKDQYRGNTLKQLPGFITAGSNWGQFGGASTSDCGLTNAVGGDIYAVAIVITILNPNFSAYLGVSDSSSLSTVLSTVALNYTGGQGLSTMYIVPQLTFGNIIYFAMPTGLSANIIFDVVGYFARSQATALDCFTTSETTVAAAAGAIWNFNAPACTAGYTRVSYGCRVDFFNSANFTNIGETLNSGGDCQATNIAAGTRNMAASSRCCRVPGR